MADGVEITAGSGTEISTDDAGAAGHVQIVKLAISADGSATPVDATTANGIEVDVTRLPALVAGTAAIGKLAANSGVDIGDVDVLSLPAINRPATSTLANVASSATNVTLQASAATRLGWTVYNDSTAVLYLKLGATASATSYTVQLGPGAFWDLPQPCYTGIIDGLWSAANGNARVTELTA